MHCDKVSEYICSNGKVGKPVSVSFLVSLCSYLKSAHSQADMQYHKIRLEFGPSVSQVIFLPHHWAGELGWVLLHKVLPSAKEGFPQDCSKARLELPLVFGFLCSPCLVYLPRPVIDGYMCFDIQTVFFFLLNKLCLVIIWKTGKWCNLQCALADMLSTAVKYCIFVYSFKSYVE